MSKISKRGADEWIEIPPTGRVALMTKIALLRLELRDTKTSEYIKQLEQELAALETRKNAGQTKPGRGRPRKPTARAPALPCRQFDGKVPVNWTSDDAAIALQAMVRSAGAVCDKHSGYGYEQLVLWLRASANALSDGDIDNASFFLVGALQQMRNATTNFLTPWAKAGIAKYEGDLRRGHRSKKLKDLEA